MNETDKTNLTDQTKFRLNEIAKEINWRKLCLKKLSRYVAVFDYIDNILIVLSVTSGRVCIFLSVSVVAAPIGIAEASFTFIFSVTIIKNDWLKKLFSITRNKKKKLDKILMLAKSKLNSIETLVSQVLIDIEISHEKFIKILKKEDKYEKMEKN